MNITFFVVASISIIALSGWRLWASHLHKVALQQKLAVVSSVVQKLESRLFEVEKQQKQELSPDQMDFKDKIHTQYAVLFQKVQDDFLQKMKDSEANFAQLLKDSYETACNKIKFDEIEYKKTITKKRKEYNRKNSHKAKPQRIWRSIMDE